MFLCLTLHVKCTPDTHPPPTPTPTPRPLARRFFEVEFGEDAKVAMQDAPHQMVRHVVNAKLRPMLWRAVHPFILAHDVDMVDIVMDKEEAKGTLVVTGYLRGRPLKVCVHSPRVLG